MNGRPIPKFPSGVRVYDVYNPEARRIFWDHLNKGIFSLGIDGWWLDSSEPDHLDFKPSDFDNKTYLGSFRKVRNAFPLMHIGGVYDHQRSVSSDKRVFILTRSAFAGQQRYGSNIWSGDVVASWGALRNSDFCRAELLTERSTVLELRYRRILPLEFSPRTERSPTTANCMCGGSSLADSAR